MRKFIKKIKNKKQRKRDTKYQIRCIDYFIDRNLIVYGNVATFTRFIPITFISLLDKDFKFQIDMDSWEELYIHRGMVMKIIESERKYDKRGNENI